MSKAESPVWRGSFGFLFTLFLFLTIAGYNAYHLSSFNTVKKLALPVFEEAGFTSFVDSFYPQIIGLARQNPEVALELPVPVPFEVKGRDIANLSSSQLKEYFATATLRAIYSDPKGLEVLNLKKEKLGPWAAVADFFSEKTHELVRVITLAFLVLALIFLFLFIYLSPGYGKLTGPGTGFLLVSLPALTSLYAARIFLQKTLEQNSALEQALLGNLGSLMFQIQVSYAVFLGAGVLLLFLGWTGRLLSRGGK